MKDIKKTVSDDPSDDSLTVRIAQEKEIPWFDQQMGQGHYLGAGRPVGDYLRQIVQLNNEPVALFVWGPACYAVLSNNSRT